MADEIPLEEQIQYSERDDVGWITINRPGAGNALTPPCRDRIRDLVEQANAAYRVRALVITASGEKLFCTGADLSYTYPNERPADMPDRVVGDARRMMLRGQYTLFPAILDSDLPIIASVNGTAAGMGAHLAFACDLVIAADHTKFVEVFARRGLVIDALGAYLLPRMIPMHKVKELAFFGDDLPVAEAHSLGLVNKVVPKESLIDETTTWAQRLATGPTKAIGLSKWLLNQSLDVDRNTMIHNEAWAVELNTYSGDSEEGIASFRERRNPSWRGW